MRNGEIMEEQKYCLMHKDDPVCAITIDSGTGVILRVSKPVNPELLPLGGNVDSQMLRSWWHRRAVPVGQGRIMRILENAGFSSTQEYLTKNWGLSLTDHYWIKPLDVSLGWSEVNLFHNAFTDPVGDLQFSDAAGTTLELPKHAFSPSSSLQGDLRKKWVIQDRKRYLIKANHGNHSHESLNEVAATLLHAKQRKKPFVSYSAIHMEGSSQLYCICESFTSDSIEFISAFDVMESSKKPNALSYYEHFIRQCLAHGLDELTVRSFLEYQILTDFILTNTDRHFRNFGILRNSDTLQFVGMAPIFDSGHAMFCDDPLRPLRDDLTDIHVNSFRSRESDLLKYVQTKNLVDMDMLPSDEELREIYTQDPLISYVDAILTGYHKKIELLWKTGLVSASGR